MALVSTLELPVDSSTGQPCHSTATAPRVLTLSGEEIHVNISSGMDVNALRAITADCLKTFKPCLSLLHAGNSLPEEMQVKDIPDNANILALVDAEKHQAAAKVHDLICNGVRESFLEYKQKRSERYEIRYEMIYEMDEIKLSPEEMEQVVAKLEFQRCTQSLSLLEECEMFAYIKRIRASAKRWALMVERKKAAREEDIGVREMLRERARAARAILQADSKLQDFWWTFYMDMYSTHKDRTIQSLARYLFLSDDNKFDYLSCPWYEDECDFECWLETNHPEAYESIYGYDEIEEAYFDMSAYEQEDNARRKQRRLAATKKAREPVARLQRSGKVRPRGGRHKRGERFHLESEV